MSATAAAPSPMAPPTRLTEPERTSPTANTPGTLDSSAVAGRAGKPLLAAAPVSTKPCLSTVTPQPSSQDVSGSAPTNKKMLRAGQSCSAPVLWQRHVAPVRPSSEPPCRRTSSV
jgi:hypothetical protein